MDLAEKWLKWCAEIFIEVTPCCPEQPEKSAILSIINITKLELQKNFQYVVIVLVNYYSSAKSPQMILQLSANINH